MTAKTKEAPQRKISFEDNTANVAKIKDTVIMKGTILIMRLEDSQRKEMLFSSFTSIKMKKYKKDNK